MKNDIKKVERFMELEGLRGVAALVVVIYHFLLAFYAVAFFGLNSSYGRVENMRFESNLYGSPLMVFTSGGFAVAIFFVLSGFVLSVAYLRTKDRGLIVKMATKRYLRLAIPALASVLFAYTLMYFHLSGVKGASDISQSGWLAKEWDFIPNFFHAISHGLLGIFTTESSSQYNNVLWTMKTELIGSFVVFGYLLLFASSSYRYIGYLFLILILFNSWLLAFVVGLMIADLYVSGYMNKRMRGYVVVSILIIGLFLGGFPSGLLDGTVYSMLVLPGVYIDYIMFYRTLGATLIIIAVLMSVQLKSILKWRPISSLGKYTFSLYLVHVPILYALTTNLFLFFNKSFGYNRSVALAIICSVPFVWVATILFERYIDSKSIKIASYCSDVYLGIRENDIKQRTIMMYAVLKSWLSKYVVKSNTDDL